MSNQDKREEIEEIVHQYVDLVNKELDERWTNWDIDLSKNEMYEVIGGLLSRQVTISTQLAKAPSIWNGHIAPMLLRAMVDVYITLAWIFENPDERSKEFVMYGLGQEKLILEHFKETLAEGGENPELERFIENKEAWLNSQRQPSMTEVNIGSWSGQNIRQMAEEVSCLDIYRHAFLPFSSATHSMWNHLCNYNLQVCRNPLHRYHFLPVVPDIDPDMHYLYLAAKYCKKTFVLFDEKTGVKTSTRSAFDDFVESLDKFSKPFVE